MKVKTAKKRPRALAPVTWTVRAPCPTGRSFLAAPGSPPAGVTPGPDAEGTPGARRPPAIAPITHSECRDPVGLGDLRL